MSVLKQTENKGIGDLPPELPEGNGFEMRFRRMMECYGRYKLGQATPQEMWTMLEMGGATPWCYQVLSPFKTPMKDSTWEVFERATNGPQHQS